MYQNAWANRHRTVQASYNRTMVLHTAETEVSPEGTVQVRVPDAPAGRRVKVTVEDVSDAPKERVFGRLKGLIEIMPSFDEPIPGFE